MFYELTWMKNEFCRDALVRVEKYAVRLLIFFALHFEHSALQKYHEESVNKNSYNKIVKNIKMFETYLC